MDLPTYSELLECTSALKLKCADRTAGGVERRPKIIASYYQQYLIAAFFVYANPVRQRVLQELELGKSLRKIDGVWKITLCDDYKTFYSRRAVTLDIPDMLYPDLEEWINNQRQVFQPQHNYIFTKISGQPYDARTLSNMFRKIVYRETGKWCSPHQVFYIKIKSKVLSSDNLHSICRDSYLEWINMDKNKDEKKDKERRGKKRIRGKGVLYDEVKKNHSIAIRASSVKKIDLKARELSLSRSEFLERLALNIEKFDFSCIASGE